MLFHYRIFLFPDFNDLLEYSMNKATFLYLTIYDFLLCTAFLLANTFIANGAKMYPLSGSIYLQALFLFTAIFLLAFLLLQLPSHTKQIHPVSSSESFSPCRVWFSRFLVLTLSWTLCLLVYFPGVGMNDGLNVLMGRLSSANQFPVYYCIYVVILGKIGNLLGSLQYAVALYSVLQILLTAAICAGILTFLQARSSSRLFRLLAAAYYILQPALAIYSISMLKDTVFSSLLVLYGILLFLMKETSFRNPAEGSFVPDNQRRKALFLLFLVSSLLISVLRSNGIYIVAACLLFLLITDPRGRKQLLITALSVLLVNIAGSMIMQHYNVRHNASETLGIPIQQISAVVAYSGDLSSEEEDILRQYIEPEKIRELYDPGSADPVKWSDSFNRPYLNASTGEFLSLWARLLPKNFKIYVQAYLQETYWFWAPVQQGGIQMFDTIEDIMDNDYLADFLVQNGIHDAPVLKGTASNFLKSFYQSGSHFFREGVCFWIMIFSIVLASCRKWKFRQILPFYLPQLLTWLTIMVSTPINNSFRYVLFYAYAMPIYVLFMTHHANASTASAGVHSLYRSR